jgi:ATP-dependent helicase/nuclease subunit A
MPERIVCDADVRERVAGDLDACFLLEAGAGTGKTRVLVERYVSCVLDPRRGTGDVRTVAAITFTEKAAGELRQRVREEFEALALRAADDPSRAEVIHGALDALDDAPISTIHGFAGRLLREFPVEAGVDPAFEQLDQLGSDLERARLWDGWLSEVAARDPLADGARKGLARLLRAGVRVEWLRELAIGPRGVFGERYDLEPVPPRLDEPDLNAALAALEVPLERLADFCGSACSNEADKGCLAALDLVEAGRVLLQRPPADPDQLAAALYALPAKDTRSAPGGAMGNWDARQGGKDELQTRYRDAVTVVTAAREAYASFLTTLAVAVADAFSRWAAAAQLAQGRLDFTDLLGRLRDLLAGDLVARAALQSRFSYILVDEFQDTDPLQAEIVFLLCERLPRAHDWREVVLQPGKLFVVGDPKQSIYRFRRADIGMYDQVKRLVAGQPDGTGAVEVIRQNFRTTPAVVGWVNNVFAGVFDDDSEEGRQPGYQWVEPYRLPAEGPRVAVLLGQDFGSAAGAAEAARRAEGQALAALLLSMRGEERERWAVQDREAGCAGAEALRPARWGDVAILFRATTGLETYEQALREAGVPYRVDGGKAYFARREVDDALLCLRAVDDPADGPAVYGALHSTFFGFSDDELFLFWSGGGRFDLFAAQPAGHAAVAQALATLRGLHERRASSEPHELAAELVRVVKASEVLAASGPGGLQAIANLEKLVDRARAFSGAGGRGLGAFLAWAAEAGDAAGEQESQVDDDDDVVHLLTIHKAKGLEYPIIIVAGGALGGGGGGGEPIVDRDERRLAIKLKAELPGAPARDLEPRRYTALREREKLMEASEARRLLYVAATRARDRLVITCFGRLRNKDGRPSAVLLGPLADVLPAPSPLAEAYEEGGMLVLPPGVPPSVDEADGAPDDEGLLRARREWSRRREELLGSARRPLAATSPSGLEHVDEEVRVGGPGAPAGRARALALGSAVHRVMELCDLGDQTSLARLAETAARELERPDLAGEAAVLAAACWRAAPVRAAARAAVSGPDRVHREVPVGALLDGVAVSGAVDLLYRDGDRWVVVDYKTDVVAEPEVLLARYRPQGGAYALAAEALLGEGSVRSVCFVAARAEQPDGSALVVTVPVDDEVRAEARREIGAAAAEGRALHPDELAAGEPRSRAPEPP